MSLFLRIMAVFYFIGSVIHLADLLDLRMQLSLLPLEWKVWIWYLFLSDFAAAVGLWLKKPWGQGLFVLIAISQLIAYLGLPSFFGPQPLLVVFHTATLLIYFILLVLRLKTRSK